MLRRVTIIVLLVILSRVASAAPERDHLKRGEEDLTADFQIIYHRAVRDVLRRAWREDVVLRIEHQPPFDPELSVGIARTTRGYLAFEVTASKHIWHALDFDHKQGKGDYRSIRPVLHERPLSAPLAARIAALWRRVLSNPRNYAEDTGVYLDSSHFSYYLAFLPRERFSAYVTGWGPQSEQLISVAGAIASYVNGGSEDELIRASKKAERKLGI
jgi:hypothetical protein